jgi:hypothetical protein
LRYHDAIEVVAVEPKAKKADEKEWKKLRRLEGGESGRGCLPSGRARGFENVKPFL